MASVAPEYKGYLLKKGDKGFKSFKRRYFILKSNRLTYYAAPEDKEPLGVISLNKVSGIHKSVQASNKKDAQCAFQIDTEGRIYYLVAENEENCKQWLDMLNNSKKYYLNVIPSESKSFATPARDDDEEDDEPESVNSNLSSSAPNNNNAVYIKKDSRADSRASADDSVNIDSINENKFKDDQEELIYLREFKKKTVTTKNAFDKKIVEVSALLERQVQEKKRAEANAEQLEKRNRELEKEITELKTKLSAKEKEANTKEVKAKDAAAQYLLMDGEGNEVKKKKNNFCANCIIQ